MNTAVRYSILVIEDDSVLNRLLLKTLERSGFDMHGALTWAEARGRIDEIAKQTNLLALNAAIEAARGPDHAVSLQRAHSARPRHRPRVHSTREAII